MTETKTQPPGPPSAYYMPSTGERAMAQVSAIAQAVQRLQVAVTTFAVYSAHHDASAPGRDSLRKNARAIAREINYAALQLANETLKP